MTFTEELRVAAAAARAAGARIREVRQQGYRVSDKGEDDPVTTADLAANRILYDALLGAFPDDGWLSEETQDDPARLACARAWIVDPLDGTKEFVRDIPEYCVSVALVEHHVPVVGVIYNPAADALYAAVRGGGAMAVPGGAPLRAVRPPGERPLLAASRSEIGRGEWACVEPLADLLPAGGAAYKLALVASGTVDATFTTAGRNEWDIAAGVLIVEEAGGRVCDREGNPFTFNEASTRRTGVFASTSEAFGTAFALYRRCFG